MDSALLFCYGTLMRGFGNNRIIADQLFIGEGKTIEDYAMYNLGRFPGLKKDKAGGTRIQGEVWQIDEKALANCDRLEGHPNFYRREKINVELKSGVGHVSAWCYFFQQPIMKFHKKIDDGVWL